MIFPEHDVLTYGGVDLGRWVEPYNVTRQVDPARSYDETTVQGVDGSLVSNVRLKASTVEVSCYMRAFDPAEVEDARRGLAAALSPRSPQALVLPVNRGLRYEDALYTGGADMDRLWQHPTLELEFLLSDPVAYGEARTASIGTAETRVDAGGTHKAFPTVTCAPPSGSHWRIENVTTGEFVDVAATFTGSQVVVLDMARQRCKVNGKDFPVSLASDFFALDGVQALRTSSGTATLKWDERWL